MADEEPGPRTFAEMVEYLGSATGVTGEGPLTNGQQAEAWRAIARLAERRPTPGVTPEDIATLRADADKVEKLDVPFTGPRDPRPPAAP